METVSSDGLLAFQSSDELTGGFFTTWGELESGGGREKKKVHRKVNYPGSPFNTCSNAKQRNVHFLPPVNRRTEMIR